MPAIAPSTTEAAAAVVRQLRGVWYGSYGMACCPAHADKNASLQISGGRKGIFYYCHTGCSGADVVAALRRGGVAQPKTSQADSDATANAVAAEGKTRALANKIWNAARPINGTPAELYLRQRGISGIDMGRYESAAVTRIGMDSIRLPALIIPYQDGERITAIQRIFLDPKTGAKTQLLDKGKAKRNLGLPLGGAMRFGDVTNHTLHLAEGPEDAASVMILHNLTGCWAVGGKVRYSHVAIPEAIRHIVIWSQRDQPAALGVHKALSHLIANNRQVTINLPPVGAGDWNDMLQAKSAEAA